jgi:hypothetical protein
MRQNKGEPPRERLTCRELATILRIKPSTVRVWSMYGLPYTACGAKLKFYDLSKVEAWLRKRTQAAQKLRRQRLQEQRKAA